MNPSTSARIVYVKCDHATLKYKFLFLYQILDNFAICLPPRGIPNTRLHIRNVILWRHRRAACRQRTRPDITAHAAIRFIPFAYIRFTLAR